MELYRQAREGFYLLCSLLLEPFPISPRPPLIIRTVSAWFGSVWGGILGGILGGIARAGSTYTREPTTDLGR